MKGGFPPFNPNVGKSLLTFMYAINDILYPCLGGAGEAGGERCVC